MKKSTMIKTSLIALAITVSLPVEAEATQAMIRIRREREAAALLAQQQQQQQQQQQREQAAALAQQQQQAQARQAELQQREQQQREQAAALAQQQQREQQQREQQQREQQQREQQQREQQQREQQQREQQQREQQQREQQQREQQQVQARQQEQAVQQLRTYVHNAYTAYLSVFSDGAEAARASENELRGKDCEALVHFATRYAEDNIQDQQQRQEFTEELERLYQNVRQPVQQAQIIARPQPLAPLVAHAKARISQAIQADRERFAYLDSPDKINAIMDHYIHLGPLPEDNIILAFAEKVCTDSYTTQVTNIAHAIARVKAALEVMKSMHPRSTILNDEDYAQAVEQRTYVYQYIDLKGKNKLSDVDFANALIDLKTVLGKGLNDPLALDENLTFRSAYNIKKFEKDAQDEKTELTDAFNAKQAILKNRVDPNNHGEDRYTLAVGGPNLPLFNEWNAGIAEINRIAAMKADDPVRLNYVKLTYGDIYSAFFEVNYVDPPGADITAIRDILLRMAPHNISNIVPSATYHADFIMGGMQNPPANNERAIFIYHAVERLDNIAARSNDKAHWNYDKNHFKARVKALFEKVPPNEIPKQVVRPEQLGHDEGIWNRELEAAQFTVGRFLVAALEGCDTGKDEKLGFLEMRYRDLLGYRIPKIKGIKAIANIIMQLKVDRILEAGKNPDNLSHPQYEENVTAPSVLTQRLNGPFGLLKNYHTVVGAYAGLGYEPKNAPLQIIKNMFLPGQPDRPYTTQRVVRVKGVNYPPGIVNIPVAPHLTVKSLVELVYNEFDKSIPHKFIEEFINGDLRLLKDQNTPLGITTGDAADGVFIQQIEGNGRVRIGPAGKPAAKDEYTREMAFFMLEKMGYVQIDPQVKADVYEFDEDEERPGTTMHRGVQKTLAGLIDEY